MYVDGSQQLDSLLFIKSYTSLIRKGNEGSIEVPRLEVILLNKTNGSLR